MKRLYGSLVLLLYHLPTLGQVTFDRLPQDLQLYPRDANNQANVVISGKLTPTGFTKVGVQVLREGKLTSVVSQTLSPTTANAPFSLTAVIKAEPAEYAFRVFFYKSGDSTLIAERNRVVCGDVYIIHGQSNALAQAGLETNYAFNFDDKYLRNCAYPYDALPSAIPGAMKWYAAKDPYGSIGGFGLTLQRLIMQTYGIPTLVLNGAEGGTNIGPLSARDPANHANVDLPYKYYGRLLFRAQWAGVANQVKAIIWKQGEYEAGTGVNLATYDAQFKQLVAQFREDYNPNARIYVGQINILSNLVKVEEAAALRDYQRRTKYLFDNVETITTVGTPGYDGIHYSPEGHQRVAFEQFRLIARDVYGSKDTVQINSPDIKKVFYNARKDTLTMVFDEGQQMVYKPDTAFYNFATSTKVYGRELKDFFYLDGQAGSVTGGTATGNRAVLSLKQPVLAKTLRYLPAYFSDAFSEYYDGPTLRNARGMRAFSFDAVPIADAIPAVTTLAAKPLTERQIQLNWTAPATAQTQLLERADGTPTRFVQLTALSGTAVTYVDNNLPDPLGTYYYRIRSVSAASESPYSNVVASRPLVLGLEPVGPLVRLYPNPLTTDRLLRVEADQVRFTALTVRDVLGRVVKTWRGTGRNDISLALDDLAAGLYVADLQTADGLTVRRKVVVR